MCQPLTKVPSISMSNFAKMITLRTHTTYTIVWFGSYKRWRFQVVVKYTGLVTLSIYILVFYRDRTCFVRLNLLTDFSIYLLKRRGLMKERALQLFFLIVELSSLATYSTVSENAGYWDAWSEWSQCTRTCDSGVRSRQRQCLSNAMCIGSNVTTETCLVSPCPGM